MHDSLFSVKDQVVLVSGASRGIGRAIAEGFAQRGAKVIITGREAATLEKAARDISATPIVCDVADAKAIDKLVKAALKECGQIDELELNVRLGVNRRMLAEKASAKRTTTDILNINLKGPFLLSQAVGKAMLSRGKGNQINIVSLNNDRPLKGVMPYAFSKAALGHMTRSLAMEWGPRGIRVNAIAPGFCPYRSHQEALVAAEDAGMGQGEHAAGAAWARAWRT